MSVDQVDRVDAIGVDKKSGDVVLTISDHLPWDMDNHLSILQEKINTYFGFVESGELVSTYPDAEGRTVVINVVAKFSLSEGAREFFRLAAGVADSAGIKLRFEEFHH